MIQNKLQDLTGQKFSKLFVIKLTEERRNKQPMWLCKCDCGREIITRGNNLRNGLTKSCGCLRKELFIKKRLDKSLEPSRAAFNRLLYAYKRSAKLRTLEFTLTEQDFELLINKSCYYCGTSANNNMHKGANGDYIYNGLDRVDNSKGYTLNNCVPCCKVCNYMKQNLSYKEFIEHIKMIYDRINEHGTHFMAQ